MTQLFGLIPSIMDLRGVAKIADNQFIIAGGMETGQNVTNKTFLITIDDLNNTAAQEFEVLDIFPNPVFNFLTIAKEGRFEIEILDVSGKVLAHQTAVGFESLDVSKLANGVYWLRVFKDKTLFAIQNFIKTP